MSVAGVAHPVERHLAKVEVASSSLVTRSIKKTDHTNVWSFFFMEWMVTGSDHLNPTVRWTVGHRRLDGDASIRGVQGTPRQRASSPALLQENAIKNPAFFLFIYRRGGS